MNRSVRVEGVSILDDEVLDELDAAQREPGVVPTDAVQAKRRPGAVRGRRRAPR